MKILKKLIKWFLLVLILIVVGFTVLWFFNAPKGLAKNTESYTRLNESTYSVAKIDLKIIDTSRATPALGDFGGDNKRTLNGAIWFPEGDLTSRPLLIYSHGFTGEHVESSHLVEHLVRNGYVVAAVDFPLSSRRSPVKIPQLLDIANQPGDVSAVIDHLLTLNNDPKSVLHQRIDPNKIGSVGLSLGGLTTALVSFHPDLKDQRITSAVMMAPPLSAFSERLYANNTQVRSLLLSGSLDRVVPEPANATQVKPRNPNGWYLSLDKGTHLGFADIGNPLRWMENPDNLGCSIMNFMLSNLDLPKRWDVAIPNTDEVIRDTDVGLPCPEISGKSMNALTQQWLTRIAITAFFDMHFQSELRAKNASKFFTNTLSTENPEVSLTSPVSK